ncbi:MAG: hypothetical protein ACK559_03985, partial [bacterium]
TCTSSKSAGAELPPSRSAAAPERRPSTTSQAASRSERSVPRVWPRAPMRESPDITTSWPPDSARPLTAAGRRWR